MDGAPGCPGCGTQVEDRFRFCPWCAAPQRRKRTACFLGHAELEDSAGRALRASRYLAGEAAQTRISLWSADGVAEAVLSLDDGETRRLGRFLLEADVPAAAAADAPTQPLRLP